MKVTLLAAHVDDIELGLGAVLHDLRYTDVSITAFVATHPRGGEPAKAIHQANLKSLGVKLHPQSFYHHLRQIDGAALFTDVWSICIAEEPDLVFTIERDSHADHQALFDATVRAIEGNDRSVLTYRPHDRGVDLNPQPIFFSVTADAVRRKAGMVSQYRSLGEDYERPYLQPNVVKARAVVAGARHGVGYAEEFGVLQLSLKGFANSVQRLQSQTSGLPGDTRR